MESIGYSMKRATYGSAGYDLCVPTAMTLRPGEWYKIDTGVRFTDSDKISVPRKGKLGRLIDRILGVRTLDKWYMAIYPRSSMGMKYGMRFSNTVGIIDSDYRNNIILHVCVDKECMLDAGERIAQGIIQEYHVLDHEIPPSAKRSGGIGSTGRR